MRPIAYVPKQTDQYFIISKYVDRSRESFLCLWHQNLSFHTSISPAEYASKLRRPPDFPTTRTAQPLNYIIDALRPLHPDIGMLMHKVANSQKGNKVLSICFTPKVFETAPWLRILAMVQKKFLLQNLECLDCNSQLAIFVLFTSESLIEKIVRQSP